MMAVRRQGAGTWAILLLLAGLLAANLWAGRRALAALDAPAPSIPAGPVTLDLSILGRVDPFFRDSAAAPSDTLPVTALPLTLKGVRLEEGSGRGVAFIAGADGQQALFVPGDEVADGATLERVAIDHVVLARGGTRETLWIDLAGRTGAAETGTTAPSASTAAEPSDDAPLEEPPSDTTGEEPDQ